MSRYPLRYRIWLGIALLHLGLMALGASGIAYEWMGPLSRGAEYYGNLSGAGETYGFFAPGIDGQMRALFDVIDRDGTQRTVTLDSGTSHEAELRVGDIIDTFENFGAESEEELVDLQRSLSASLASTIFSRNPGARRVAVRLEHYDPVSMEEYRAGERGSWSQIYQATFETHEGDAK